MAASKPPQILHLSPASEIVFEGPFKNVVTSDLELTNPSDKRVCFKVKTTAPRRYCVRPNSGIIEPGMRIKIHIMLQPLDAEGLAEGHKHKFMVQSIVVRDHVTSSENVWADIDPRSIMDSKLRCVFHSSPTSAPSSTTESSTAEPAAGATNDATVGSSPAIATAEPVAASATAAAPTATITTTTKPTPIIKPTITTPTTTTPTTTTRTTFTTTTNTQPPHSMAMAQDHRKVVLVSLIMLVIGLIVGKFII